MSAVLEPPAAIAEELPVVGGPAPMQPYSPTFRQDEAEARARAQAVWERHRKGREAKSERDLNADLCLAYLDGQNQGQWLDIQYGQIVRVPQDEGSIRVQDNLLAMVVSNAVAYHTSARIRVLARPRSDSRSRKRSQVDTLLVNDALRRNQYEQLLACVLGIGGATYGVGLIHAFWRDDQSAPEFDPYAVAAEGEQGGYGPKVRRGFVDLVVGDPWSTVFDKGSTRHCVHRVSYERTVPLSLAQQAFADVPGARDLKGSERLASASRLQRSLRLSRTWATGGPSRLLTEGAGDGDELVALIFEETAPGVDPEWAKGRLTVAALSGSASGDPREGQAGEPVLLFEGPLPGGVLSVERFYLCPPEMTDDVYGRPWIEPLLENQQTYNMMWVRVMNYIAKLSDPLLVAQANMIDKDDLSMRGGLHSTRLLEYMAGQSPFYLQIQQGLQDVMTALDRAEQSLYRKAAYNASSRGEGKAGDAAAKVVALSKADDSLHATAAAAIAEATCSLCRRIHAITRAHLTVPWVLETAGRDVDYLASPYVYASQMSEEPPLFEQTTGWGLPENRQQQLLNLLGQTFPDGTPLIDKDDFWDQWPDQSLRPLGNETAKLQKRRAKQVTEWIRTAAQEYRQAVGEDSANDYQGAAEIFQRLMQGPLRPRRDDDHQFTVTSLSEVTQDAESDAVAVLVAEWRQDYHYQMMGQQVQPAEQPAPGAQPQQPQQQADPAQQQQAQQQPAAPPSVDPNLPVQGSQSMDPQAMMGEVRAHTAEAEAQAA